MPKQRLVLGNNTLILCKHIISITVNGKTYYKSDYTDSMDIQNFYRLFQSNKEGITMVEFYYNKHVLPDAFETYTYFYDYGLPKRKHNLSGPSTIYKKADHVVEQYYIDDEVFYNKEDWDKQRIHYLRSSKMERILNEL